MAQELKIRIDDPKEIEDKLKKLGATLTEESTFEDTYFKQPEGEVLKIVQGPRNTFTLIHLNAKDGKFDVIGKEVLQNGNTKLQELTAQFGVKDTLHGTRKTYAFEGDNVQFNFIDEVGNFLVLSGERPSAVLFNRLGISQPRYVTVPFVDLKTSA